MVTAPNGNSNWLLQGLWDIGVLEWAVGYASGGLGHREKSPPVGNPDTHLLRGSKGQGSTGHRCNGGWLWGSKTAPGT